jgi:glucose/mannose transport system permease protein
MFGKSRDRTTAVLVIMPSIILLAIFVYGFIGQTIALSMSDWRTLDTQAGVNFIGLENYTALFTNATNLANYRFRQDIVNTVFFTVFFLAACLGLGLGLAILIDQKIRAESLFRTIFLFPMALSFVVTGTVWRWLFSPRSGLNTLPAAFGLPPLSPEAFPWFTDRRAIATFAWGDAMHWLIGIAVFGLLAYAAYSAWKKKPTRAVILGVVALGILGWWIGGAGQVVGAVRAPANRLNLAMISIVIAATWQMSGYTMAMYLAGLRGIPDELREAARVDGCNEVQVYRFVVLPLLQPITLSAIIILGHISLKIFDLVYVMAGGDNLNVDVPGIHMYLTAFRGNNFAVGAAIAIVMLILVAVVIVPYLVNSLRTEVSR